MTTNKRIEEILEWVAQNSKEISDPHPFGNEYTYADFIPTENLADYLRTTLASFAAERDAALEKTLREEIEAREKNGVNYEEDNYEAGYNHALRNALAIITDTFKSSNTSI